MPLQDLHRTDELAQHHERADDGELVQDEHRAVGERRDEHLVRVRARVRVMG